MKNYEIYYYILHTVYRTLRSIVSILFSSVYQMYRFVGEPEVVGRRLQDINRLPRFGLFEKQFLEIVIIRSNGNFDFLQYADL